jgi:hypothetical protein
MSNDTIIYLIRLISLLILILVIIYDIHNDNLKNKNIQILLAIIIMFIFLFIDPLSGFLIACAVFVIYYKIYDNNNFKLINGRLIKKNNNTDNILYNNYINNEHLEKAQNNIISDPSNELNGFDNMLNKKDILGAQGLSEEMNGYNNNYIGAELDEL